jgi:small subunit ribosomal protein S8
MSEVKTTLLDPLANALSKIQNAEWARKKETTVSPISKLVRQTLELMRREGYIESFEVTEDGRGIRVVLRGKINECGAIKPRHSVGKDEYEKWERRFLPAAGYGMLIVSTSKGIMVHREAIEKNLGGKLLAYVF